MLLNGGTKERALPLRGRLSSCDLCPRRCQVDRTHGPAGICRTADDIPVASVGLHFGEEPPISGTRGSGTVFFANCNLRCVYCQNYQISQRAHEIPIRSLSPDELAGEMLALQLRGAHNVNLVSPTHVMAQVVEALCIASERGLSIPIVYNTNGYDAVETLRCVEGLIDVYLPDIKYSDDAMARACSGVDDYVVVSRRAIEEMFRQVGNLTLDGEGIAQRGILVRHLVLPEDRAGSAESLAFLAAISRDMHISIMAQYSPQFRAGRHPPLGRRIMPAEYETVLDAAWELGLENCFVQESESSDVLLPDFRRSRPFEEQ